MDWRAFLILSKTRDYERMQFDRRREDYKRTKERILKYSLQNQVKWVASSWWSSSIYGKYRLMLNSAERTIGQTHPTLKHHQNRQLCDFLVKMVDLVNDFWPTVQFIGHAHIKSFSIYHI